MTIGPCEIFNVTLAFDSPSRVTPVDLAQLESDLGISLPQDYADFLLRFNGGVPKPNILSLKDGAVIIEAFYSVYPGTESSVEGNARNLVSMTMSFRSDLELPESLLPIADIDGEDILVLDLDGGGIGKLSAWPFIDSGFDVGTIVPVAKSLTHLLAILRNPPGTLNL